MSNNMRKLLNILTENDLSLSDLEYLNKNVLKSRINYLASGKLENTKIDGFSFMFDYNDRDYIAYDFAGTFPFLVQVDHQISNKWKHGPAEFETRRSLVDVKVHGIIYIDIFDPHPFGYDEGQEEIPEHNKIEWDASIDCSINNEYAFSKEVMRGEYNTALEFIEKGFSKLIKNGVQSYIDENPEEFEEDVPQVTDVFESNDIDRNDLVMLNDVAAINGTLDGLELINDACDVKLIFKPGNVDTTTFGNKYKNEKQHYAIDGIYYCKYANEQIPINGYLFLNTEQYDVKWYWYGVIYITTYELELVGSTAVGQPAELDSDNFKTPGAAIRQGLGPFLDFWIERHLKEIDDAVYDHLAYKYRQGN